MGSAWHVALDVHVRTAFSGGRSNGLWCVLCCVHPQADVDAGRISSAQHETLVYANMRFNGPRLPGGGWP